MEFFEAIILTVGEIVPVVIVIAFDTMNPLDVQVRLSVYSQLMTSPPFSELLSKIAAFLPAGTPFSFHL